MEVIYFQVGIFQNVIFMEWGNYLCFMGGELVEEEIEFE